MTDQPEALILAEKLEEAAGDYSQFDRYLGHESAAMLRKQHAKIEHLRQTAMNRVSVELHMASIAELQKEIERLRGKLAQMPADGWRQLAKTRVLKAIEDGVRTSTKVAAVTGLPVGLCSATAFRLYKDGVLRRRGPLPIRGTGGCQFVYGRALRA